MFLHKAGYAYIAKLKVTAVSGFIEQVIRNNPSTPDNPSNFRDTRLLTNVHQFLCIHLLASIWF